MLRLNPGRARWTPYGHDEQDCASRAGHADSLARSLRSLARWNRHVANQRYLPYVRLRRMNDLNQPTKVITL